MNTHKTEEGLFHHHDLDPTADILVQSPPSILHHHHDHNSEVDPAFSLPEFILFRSSPSGDSPGLSSDEQDDSLTGNPQIADSSNSRVSSAGRDGLFISPDPHISSQFYTFNAASHSLMCRCLREGRLATPAEIRIATPRSVLKSWRAVWKDRNEETAYLTAWKRIQDKLTSRLDPATGNEFLCFKNNSQQFVSHINQWQDIVMGFHADGDLKHLGQKETIDRIKQVWTVGAKLYGIPESFIRVCVAACPVCNADSGSASRNKRRRFEYTESLDVPAKEVPDRLQQLAAKHKVVLCIRQKYIRYKPFMAEVKDYACHRAGEPVSIKKSRILKREPYQSKRCGCGFRIRAIVPIANYSEKTKTFVYQEEGTAVFKLYAVHSGHEPGAMDGNARIMHRVVGHKGFLMDQETVYGVRDEDVETEGMGLTGKDERAEMQFTVLHQVQELRSELGTLEGKIGNFSQEMLGSVSTELFEMLNKIRNIGVESVQDTTGLVAEKSHSDEILVGDNDLVHWSDHHHEHLYGDGKDAELIEDDEDSFERSLDDVVPWEQITPPSDCTNQKEDLLSETCKPEKWLKCNDFDENSILNSEDSKLTKPMSHDGGSIETDVGLAGIQVDSFYQENSKWYDSPCGLDSNTDGEDTGFSRHGEIL
ncbi:hypothetical protein AtNW77_Chr3g0217631 [Arabidopsis thaliana]|uniref:Uncharacterized protein n=2 Tax=Arabidopsis TaxID=3701 RepID=A0A8T2EZ60_9BRAS|nr:hypothetical protein ISN45_At03g053900 [Arabidopsis thaliana x Arabidopsis arenosa]OAP05009.1 hypothetical protein AXX17_AT3G55220 [Arabidopsis thaliana]CAA0387737.1 unnamed protein product [Arabidopsis thaliana]CAD5326395.1 unnamed protein product [Arabidopsis thaliana]VYS61033.1 unnamed protein product [Arabidopsis thaliana]